MAHAPKTHSWHAFAQGTRVMDTVSGMDGVVSDTRITHTVEPAGKVTGEVLAGRLIPWPNPVVHESVLVKLDDGSTVERSPKVLVAL